jgi:probable rRNA maturation factor
LKLHIDIAANTDGWPDDEVLERLARKAVGAAASVAKLDMPDGAELSLVFTDDAEMRAINAQWRGIDKPTNVLSFPAADIAPGESAEQMLGDIVFARDTVEREAVLEGKRFEDHLTHLMVHGFLHLFGYDHMNEDDARVMEGLESRALAELGIADPYAA